MKKYLEKNINMVAIINGSPWSPWQPPFNHPYADRQGLIIDNGQIVAPILPGRPAFVVTKDGQVFFKLMAKDTNISNYLHAISGFAFVLNDGEVIKSKAKSLAPRTGYGLSKDKKTLYLFVVDGRQPKYSMGMSTYEVGEFLQYLGAHTGLNMDGGGSSTLIIKDGNKLNMLNKQKWGERTVGGAMGLIYQ
jgi:exopolysaccharide biosynthesis protein